MKKKTAKKPFFVNDLDRYAYALKKVNLSEAAVPFVNGKIVEDSDTYNKVQQLLDCPDMEHAHQFLLDIDFDELTPEVVKKVDDLYQLAVQEGFISTGNEETEEDFEDEEAKETEEENQDSGETQAAVPPASQEDLAKSYVGDMITPIDVASCAYVCFYSAMKNGQIRTGECYSNAMNPENARADAVRKLQKLGFTAVDILACEECDPSARGTGTTQPDKFGEPVYDSSSSSEEDIVGEAEEEKADNEKEASEEKEDSKDIEKDPEADISDDAEEEMSRADKIETFKKYLSEFKNLLQKMKRESYADMSLAERAKFYDEMSKVWSGKPDPTEFMTDANVKQIETMRVKITK